MRNGTLDSVLCLEKVILDQVDILFPDGNNLSREEAKYYLDLIKYGIQKFYWAIYNDHVGCAPLCGTIFHLMHLGANSDVIEEMIRDMIRQRKRYEY